MPIGDIFKAIGLVKGVGKGSGGPPSARAGMRPGEAAAMRARASGAPAGMASGAPDKFDFNRYLEAWQIFIPDFFGKKIPYFFQNIQTVMPQIPDWFTGLPDDEKIAYGVLAGGHVLFLVGIVLLIVL